MSLRTARFLSMLSFITLACLAAGPASPAPADPTEPEAAPAPHAAPKPMTGKVTDVLESGGYTYAKVDTGKEVVWAATNTTPVKKGDEITFSSAMPMYDFHSNTLNRDFPVVYFTDRFLTGAAHAGAMAVKHPPHPDVKAAEQAGPIAGIEKVKGGYTIAELIAGKKKLAGKTVRVRGKVTKYTPGVMNKNWIHIRDSSSAEDLAITTDGKTALGDVIVVEGKLGTDKDYGYGYVYPVIVEDAKLKQE